MPKSRNRKNHKKKVAARNMRLASQQKEMVKQLEAMKEAYVKAKQEKETMIWTREKHFFKPTMTFSKIVVHGHTPKEKVEHYPYRINLDTGSFYSGKLSCLIIEDQQLKFIET